jgi:transposase
VLGQRTVAASDAGTLDALRFVCQLSGQRVWAIEGCRHVSGRIERALVACGERVIRIPPPALTINSRRAARDPGKSDPIYATAVARAAIREGVERFPVAFLEQAMEIRLLNDYRDQLVAERTSLLPAAPPREGPSAGRRAPPV